MTRGAATAEVGRSTRVYEQILVSVGGRAAEIPRRDIAAHWPFVGSQYRGLVIVGQALKGWDAAETPARWRADDAVSPEGRDRLLASAQAWAQGRSEPLTGVLRWGHRSRSPFWGFSKRLVPLLEPDGDAPWYARCAWWNVYPLGWDEPDESPTGLLKDLQTPLVGELFWSVLDDLDAQRVVLVSGKDWWPEVRELLGLADLRPGSTPVIAAGRLRGRTIVATYHPGAHLKGVSRDAFAAAVADAVHSIESEQRGGEMASGTDSAGHRFVEFDKSDNEQIRVTYIPYQPWADGPTLRVQKHADTGRMMPGPEFPADKADDLISAIRDVLRR